MYLYHDRSFFQASLYSRLYGDDNILENVIFVMLGCVEIVAEVRARAMFQGKLAEPLVFFCCGGVAVGAWSRLWDRRRRPVVAAVGRRRFALRC